MAIFEVNYPHKNGNIGQIRIPVGRKIEDYAMHESIHAAFELSRYLKWRCDTEDDREEFIAHVSEYIFTEIKNRLRKRNHYR